MPSQILGLPGHQDFCQKASDRARKGIGQSVIDEPCTFRVLGDVPDMIPPILVLSEVVVIEADLPARQFLPIHPESAKALELRHCSEHVGTFAEPLEHDVEVIRHEAIDRHDALGRLSSDIEVFDACVNDALRYEDLDSLTGASRECARPLSLIQMSWQPLGSHLTILRVMRGHDTSLAHKQRFL